jgi:hypothetical protein
MEAVYEALQANHTSDLVPPPPSANVVTGKWIFKLKLNVDGSLERYKTRYVLRGFTQRPGVDYDETFSSVVKPATVWTVLTLSLSRDWPVHQLYMKNAFLHDTMTKTVYCTQPIGFVDPAHPNMVCKLNKSLYGLKQAPWAWYSRFTTFLCSQGFVEAKLDTPLFILRRGPDTAYLLLYVDDIVLTSSSPGLLRRIISFLQQEFAMKDLEALHFLEGHYRAPAPGHVPSPMTVHRRPPRARWRGRVQALRDPSGHAGQGLRCGPPVTDPIGYQSLAGAMQYLIFTWPDIAYAVQQVCLHMHDPREPHLTTMKRILRY